jgi:DNA-binding phage protein
MMSPPTTKFEPEKHFKSAAAQRDLLQDALSSGDAGYIADALQIVARAEEMMGAVPRA